MGMAHTLIDTVATARERTVLRRWMRTGRYDQLTKHRPDDDEGMVLYDNGDLIISLVRNMRSLRTLTMLRKCQRPCEDPTASPANAVSG